MEFSELAFSQERIEDHFHVLAGIGNLGTSWEHGFLRASWSFEETAAMEYIKRCGEQHGLRAAYDGIGNLYLTTPTARGKVIQVGSHMDTVPIGGLYDGSAGVVAGLEAILALKPCWDSLEKALELVVWRGEESATFNAVCKGSQAAFGLNPPNILGKYFEGKTLEEAIISQRFNPAFIRNRKPTLSQEKVDSIAAHLELHIEQANRLQVDRVDIGVATSIRGTVRLRVLVSGDAAHSGATPMGTAYRQDANLAIAYMQVELDRLAQSYLAQGKDLVQTVGVVNADSDYNLHNPRVYESSLTKVCPFGYFTLDVRSNQQAFLDQYMVEVRERIESVGEALRVFVSFEGICNLPPLEELDPELQDFVEASCRCFGFSSLRMPSGAIHDVAVVARQTHSDGTAIPAGLVFIPCRDGISHNPKEYSSPEALLKGVKVLAKTLYQFSNH